MHGGHRVPGRAATHLGSDEEALELITRLSKALIDAQLASYPLGDLILITGIAEPFIWTVEKQGPAIHQFCDARQDKKQKLGFQ